MGQRETAPSTDYLTNVCNGASKPGATLWSPSRRRRPCVVLAEPCAVMSAHVRQCNAWEVPPEGLGLLVVCPCVMHAATDFLLSPHLFLVVLLRPASVAVPPPPPLNPNRQEHFGPCGPLCVSVPCAHEVRCEMQGGGWVDCDIALHRFIHMQIPRPALPCPVLSCPALPAEFVGFRPPPSSIHPTAVDLPTQFSYGLGPMRLELAM